MSAPSSIAPALTFLPLGDALMGVTPPVSWVIPDFLPAGSLIALAGEAGTGKSFLAYTLGLALAGRGKTLDWDFTQAPPKRILYFDQENSLNDSTEYLRWAWRGLGRLSIPLLEQHFYLVPFQLGAEDWAVKAAAYVRLVQPDLIILDTTTPICNVQDENDNAEATRTIKAIRWLMAQVAPTAACLALKHAKLRADGVGYTLRGAKAWEGAVDGIVYHVRPKGRPTTAQAASGLRPTSLVPAKTRAFGLRHTVTILPEWTSPARDGLVLLSAPGNAGQPQGPAPEDPPDSDAD